MTSGISQLQSESRTPSVGEGRSKKNLQTSRCFPRITRTDHLTQNMRVDMFKHSGGKGVTNFNVPLNTWILRKKYIAELYQVLGLHELTRQQVSPW